MSKPKPVPYETFRAGVTFTAARAAVVAESAERYAREGQYIRPTRRRILGKMREMKLSAYEHYRRTCHAEAP